MFGNASSGPRTRKLESLIEALYEFFEFNSRGRYAVYGITLLSVLTYALFSDLVLGRRTQDVAIECAIITVVFIVTLPLAYNYLTSNETVRPVHLVPLGIAYGVFAVILLFSTALYYLSTIGRLKADIDRSKDKIEETQKQILHFREYPFLAANFKEGDVQLTLLVNKTASVDNKLRIRLLEVKNYDNDSLVQVTINVSYPGHPSQKIVFEGLGKSETYHGGENFEIKLLKAGEHLAKLLVRQIDDSNSKEEQSVQN